MKKQIFLVTFFLSSIFAHAQSFELRNVSPQLNYEVAGWITNSSDTVRIVFKKHHGFSVDTLSTWILEREIISEVRIAQFFNSNGGPNWNKIPNYFNPDANGAYPTPDQLLRNREYYSLLWEIEQQSIPKQGNLASAVMVPIVEVIGVTVVTYLVLHNVSSNARPNEIEALQSNFLLNAKLKVEANLNGINQATSNWWSNTVLPIFTSVLLFDAEKARTLTDEELVGYLADYDDDIESIRENGEPENEGPGNQNIFWKLLTYGATASQIENLTNLAGDLMGDAKIALQEIIDRLQYRLGFEEETSAISVMEAKQSLNLRFMDSGQGFISSAFLDEQDLFRKETSKKLREINPDTIVVLACGKVHELNDLISGLRKRGLTSFVIGVDLQDDASTPNDANSVYVKSDMIDFLTQKKGLVASFIIGGFDYNVAEDRNYFSRYRKVLTREMVRIAVSGNFILTSGSEIWPGMSFDNERELFYEKLGFESLKIASDPVNNIKKFFYYK